MGHLYYKIVTRPFHNALLTKVLTLFDFFALESCGHFDYQKYKIDELVPIISLHLLNIILYVCEMGKLLRNWVFVEARLSHLCLALRLLQKSEELSQ